MTPHQVLEIPTTATPEEVRTAYRRLVAKYHPDREGGSAEDVQRIVEAYEAILGGKVTVGGKTRDLAKMSPNEKAQTRAELGRHLYAVNQKIKVVMASIVTWNPDDNRIPKMLNPHLEKKAEIERNLRLLE